MDGTWSCKVRKVAEPLTLQPLLVTAACWDVLVLSLAILFFLSCVLSFVSQVFFFCKEKFLMLLFDGFLCSESFEDLSCFVFVGEIRSTAVNSPKIHGILQ